MTSKSKVEVPDSTSKALWARVLASAASLCPSHMMEKGESPLPKVRDVGAEDVIHQACGSERCVGEGDREISGNSMLGEECRDDGILLGLWTVHEGGVDLGEASFVGHVAEV